MSDMIPCKVLLLGILGEQPHGLGAEGMHGGGPSDMGARPFIAKGVDYA